MMTFIPFLISLLVTAICYYRFGWWGFWIMFPWIGASVSIGNYLKKILPKEKRSIGRRVSILLIMPILLIFLPFTNHENLQLEGVVLIVLVGIFGKGFVHYAIAKIFGPLIWGRGFCGWACWIAAVLDWLPIRKEGKRAIPSKLKNVRYVALAISILLPIILVFGLSYDVRTNYVNKTELSWMIIGNIIYYLLAIPLAYYFKDRRAFCKIACPVALVMSVPSKFALIKKKPSGIECIKCGICNKVCIMDNDVMSFISRGEKVVSTECILCDECKIHCPVGAIS